MKTKTRKATKTEYRGILYRSKCEAMFARYLELESLELAATGQSNARQDGLNVTNSGFGFQYEPNTLVEGWNPDFLVWNILVPGRTDGIDKKWFCHSIAIMFLSFIEYKPSRPTEAYCSRFSKGVQEWLKRFESDHDEARRTSFEIFYGNPYEYPNAPCGVLKFENDLWFDDTECDWLANYVDDIRDYRFDLKNGGENSVDGSDT